jgi:hypothetical protein
MAEHKNIVGGLGVALFVLGLGGILSRPVVLAEYPKAHFPGWTLWAGVLSLVVGLYLLGAVIWDWPFPGRGATGGANAFARQNLVLTVRRHDAYMERADPPPGGRMLIKLSVAIYVHNPNASAVSVLDCHLEHVAVQTMGSVQIKGMPPIRDPLPVAYPEPIPGNASMRPEDEGFAHPPLLRPGSTAVLDCDFYLPAPGDAHGWTIPLRVSGTPVVVDDQKNYYSAGTVNFR